MNPISKRWPLYSSKTIHVKDPYNHIAIITLWSKKENYISLLKDIDYNTIGQLYSKSEGISLLIRNLLANKYITDLVIVGKDMNSSKDALKDFFSDGIDNDYNIISDYNIKIDRLIEKDSIDDLRDNIKVHDFTKKDDDQLISLITKIKRSKPYGDAKIFSKPKLLIPDTFPSERSVFKIEDKYVKDVWKKILQHINNFGTIKKTQYGDKQREIITAVSVITDENPDDFRWDNDFNFTKQDLKKYMPQVTTPKEVEGLEYTYGQKLRNFRGIDQIFEMIKQLKKENYTRRAVGVTWDIIKDYNNPKCPCLNLVQTLVQDNKVYLTCYFRSHDIYAAYPRNAFALRKLQQIIAKKLDLNLGNLIIISNSAHIYERDFNNINSMIKDQKQQKEFDVDKRGSFAISIDNNIIIIKQVDRNGNIIDKLQGKTALELIQKLSDDLKISKIEHALDIGSEIQKAQIAIDNGLEYVQDKKLIIK